MAINKVQYGNTVLLDLTSDTVTADKLMQGYTAHDRTGALITGTATGGGGTGGVTQDQDGYLVLDDQPGSGSVTVESLSVTQNGTYTAPTGKAYSPVTVNVSGGGGLVYESGTWNPATDISRGEISFTNTHTEPPNFIVLRDETGTDDFTSNSNWEFVWVDFSGTPISWSSSTDKYAIAHYLYRGTSTTSLSAAISSITYPYSSQDDSVNSAYRYWVTAGGFKPSSSSDSRYWRAGRTYKWIAVWKPTT